MKIILTCGHPESGYRHVYEMLVNAGLAPLHPAEQPPSTAIELRKQIFSALGVAQDAVNAGGQLKPEQKWRIAAEQLLNSNQAQPQCGWADAGSVWLLEFWKSLGLETDFLLVYSAPQQAIGDMLFRTREENVDIDALVSGWIASNNELLRFYHRNRDRCQLVNACVIDVSPVRLIESVSDAFGVDLDADKLKSHAPPARPSAVAAALGFALIEDYDELHALYREMESSADIEGGSLCDSRQEKFRAWREFTTLSADRDAWREQAVAHLEGSKSLRTECDLMAAKTAHLTRDLESAHSALKSVEEAKVRGERDLSQVKARNTELVQSGQLQVLQIKQVQEELAHYFSRYQELVDKQGADTRELVVLRRFLKNNQPAEAVIDLKGEIDGENWYYAEKEGRWAGPGNVSTLNIPRLAPGEYKMQIDVVDAMEPEILAGMEVLVNGRAVELKHQGRRYPTRAFAQFSVDDADSRSLWEIRFKFPRLVSPAQHGSTDERSLAVRVQTVHLTLLD
jgi:hypothetical protein